jgi:oxygen-independent coproporphyrinogen-3 oxidase
LAKCPYCDFVSYARSATSLEDERAHERYADAVLRELERRAPSIEGRRIESVFFGGGTPSLWEPRQLGRVVRGVRDSLSCADEVEVTVECNPTSIDRPRAEALVREGVNRVSIGVQSLRDDRLRFLGRLHDATQGLQATRDALSVVPRVSADLIFGLPGQTPAEAVREASELADLGLSHVSCYQLTIEAGTRFGELARRGRLPLADDGAVAESFLAIDEALVGRGFAHYEVSNYARPGQSARHNLGYWRGDEYLGLGCAAVGFVRTGRGEGLRYRNDLAPDRYIDAATGPLPEGIAPPAANLPVERLDAPTLMRERIMLGLRVEEGIDVAAAGEELGLAGWTPARERAAEWLVHRGRVVREGTRLRIPRAARLWTDDTAARLF